MEQVRKKGEYIFYYTCLLFGLSAIWLFVDHIAKFSYPDYFYADNPGVKKYAGVNVVAAWADFSYFTYHTILLFAFWTIGLFVGFVTKKERIENFFKHQAFVVFILSNYIVTTLLSTVFELTSGNPTFGLYARTTKAWHNFGTNMLGHYVFCLFTVVAAFYVKTKNALKWKHIMAFLLYLLVYYVIVKLTGLYAYEIEWYPYPIFDGELLWNMFRFSSYTIGKGIWLLIGINVFIAVAYVFLLLGIKKVLQIAKKEKDTTLLSKNF